MEQKGKAYKAFVGKPDRNWRRARRRSRLGIILSWNLCIYCGVCELDSSGKNSDQWWALANTVMSFGFVRGDNVVPSGYGHCDELCFVSLMNC